MSIVSEELVIVSRNLSINSHVLAIGHYRSTAPPIEASSNGKAQETEENEHPSEVQWMAVSLDVT